jgi:hydroxypyruvate reductase
MKHIMVLPVIEHARKIWEAGLRAVHAGNAVQSCLKRKENTLTCGGHEYDLDAFDAIYAVGAGKASAAMARPVEEMLRERLKAGIINVKYGHGVPLITIKVNEAGHPVPDEAGVRGTREIVSLLEKATERDLVICLISGGGSALMPCPAKGLTLEDKQSLTVRLLECGANIQEINALRKHLSQVKGGRLAQLAYPATVVSFILSDVIGDDLSSIASGPTFPDSTTFDDCLRILEKYGLKKIIPKPVLEFLERGVRGDITETPKPGAPAFERTQNVIIGNNLMALRGARQKAEELGYNTLIQSDSSSREARELAKEHAALAREISRSGRPLRRPACIISGG